MEKKEMKDLFNPERRNKAKEYNKTKDRYNIIQFVMKVVFLIVVFGFSMEMKLYQLLNNIHNQEIKIIIYIFTGYLILSLYQTIFDYFLNYRLNRKFELSTQDERSWIIDQIKSFVLGLIVIYLAGRMYIYLVTAYPQFWWIYFSLLASIFTVILTFLLPVVLLPLFFRLESYPESDLKDRLMKLVKRAGVNIEDIYEINLSSKINASNAAVIGLGKTRKVILGDKLKERYSNEEIEAVLAHELGHQIHGDIFKNLLIQPFMLLFTAFLVAELWPLVGEWYGYQRITAVYTLPLLLVLWSFLSWLISPLQLFLSRKNEKAADLYAIRLCKFPRALATALAKLADESLGRIKINLYKRIFKAAHPPIGERINYILQNIGDEEEKDVF